MNLVVINQIKYEVVERAEAGSMRPLTAASMKRQGIVAYVGLRRPKGWKVYQGFEYASGSYALAQ